MSLFLLIDSKNKRTELYQDNKCLFSINRTSSKITLGLLDTVHFLGHDNPVEAVKTFELSLVTANSSKVYTVPMDLLCCLDNKEDIINSTIREVVNTLINREMKKCGYKESPVEDILFAEFIDI